MTDTLSTYMSSYAPRAISWLGRLATLAVIALLAWTGARVFWTLTAPVTPDPAIAVDTEPTRVAQAVAGRHVFGEAPVAAIGMTGAAATNVKLFGVVARGANGRAGIAIISVQGKPAAAFREGEEIASGVMLHRVLVRSVEISQGGAIQVLTLPERGKT